LYILIFLAELFGAWTLSLQHELTVSHRQSRSQRHEFNGIRYRAIFHESQVIYICPSRRLINVTQLFKAAGYSRTTLFNKIKELEITREVIKGYPAQLQGTYVDYDDYLRYINFLGLDQAIIPHLMKDTAEAEPEGREEEVEKEGTNETNGVADGAEVVEDLLLLRPSTRKPYSRTYDQNGCTFYPIMISGAVVYLCPAKRLVNATHLIQAAGYHRRDLKKTLDDYQISVAQQVTGHNHIRGSYLIYDDGLAFLQHLGLDAPVDLFGYADRSTGLIVLPGKEFALGRHHENFRRHHGASQFVSGAFESRVAYESSYRSHLLQVFPRLSAPANDHHFGCYSGLSPTPANDTDENSSSTMRN
jgi:hypothetical protein